MLKIDRIQQLNSLPRLSWIFEADKECLSAYTGTDVEVFEDGVFEGAWEGKFKDFDFQRCENVFGSGFCVNKNGIRFVTPSHTLESLYAVVKERGFLVSNSLSFLVYFSGIDLPYKNWGELFASIVYGFDNYQRLLHKTEFYELYRISFENFEIRDGRLFYYKPKIGPAFSTYDSYLVNLKKVLCAVFENGKDTARRQKFTPIASCSSGYDSAACAALGRELGCTDALTLRKSRDNKFDSGFALGRSLGLHVIEIGEESAGSALNEIEFMATGMGGEDLPFKAFEDYLENRILLTGFHGDKIWDPKTLPSDNLERGDISGSSMGEYRLRVGFINLPVPFIGARRHASIQRVTLGLEMQPFSIGGRYDRPVPRRIVEDMGVERSIFGQEKKAVSSLIFSSPKYLSAETLKAFLKEENDLVANERLLYLFIRLLHELRWFFYRLSKFICNRHLKTVGMRKFFENLFLGDLRVFQHGHPRYSNAMFLWAIKNQMKVYKIAMNLKDRR